MSSIWQGAQAQAARFGSWSDLPPQGEFQPLYGLDESGFAPRLHLSTANGFEENSEPPVSIEALTADAFAEGFEEGTRVGRAEQDADRAAHLRLSLALEQLQAESSGALSALLSTAVLRLVRQIAGEVEIDADLLAKRCLAIAECIEQEVGQPALHLHPDDVALMEAKNLPVRLVPDAEMLRGSVRLETADGWVEDGPEIRLSRLQGLLDDMTGQA
ncbi:FliH/SctL family protein [Rhizorhapis sp. SPR117]|uniref:FliH/SctL family protein n=1 Tax=Rhizorhapis sp. SPR117 TaxID=2912611 RepID=UPI001F3FCFE6|nr:flagellar assembly protein FliH [Rhizorhapis sp. SPR117]